MTKQITTAKNEIGLIHGKRKNLLFIFYKEGAQNLPSERFTMIAFKHLGQDLNYS